MNRIFAFLVALIITSAANAQTYPERTDPGVNDFANIIDSITETRINSRISEIAEDHDVEVTVATLSSLRFYAEDSTIEDYGLGLFNNWQVGNAETNDGILLLVFRDDRYVRFVLGKGYDDNAIALETLNDIVETEVTPNFRNGDYGAGIEAGVNGVQTRVLAAEPTSPASPESTSEPKNSNTLYYVLGAIGAAIAGLIGLNRRNAAKFAAQACSNCGKTGLQKSREVLREPTLEENGAGETRVACPSCGHIDATPFTISKLTPEQPKEGGKSSGSGATGKW